jgi:predicted transposase/invertase (TIGR01784 family)
MLEGILGKPITSLEIIDRDLPGELTAHEDVELDIRVRLDDGSRADVGMQMRATAALRSRLVFQATRDYSSQPVRGGRYEDLTPTAVVVWLVEPLFPSLGRLHSTFELFEQSTHTPIGDAFALHVLQLSEISRSPRTSEDARAHRWARFLTAQTDAEFEQLASDDPIMSLAKKTLETLSQDPDVQRRAREREDARALYEIDLATSKRLGKAELLLELLGERFGPPSEATRARVTAATSKQLDTWAKRIFTATTLDEMLAP